MAGNCRTKPARRTFLESEVREDPRIFKKGFHSSCRQTLHVLYCLGFLIALFGSAGSWAQSDCRAANDLLLKNGHIHTMAADRQVVSSLRIIDDRVVAIGAAAGKPGPE